MNGFLIIDKPIGATSFDMVRRVRRWSGVRRVGHAGTLDPLATGVLPVAIGKATRLIEYLMAGDKIYQATMKLGESTDTQDAEGEVLEEKDWRGIAPATINAVTDSFTGQLQQLPPMFSALKKDGQPLYKLARQGVAVERKSRPVMIESLVIDKIELPFVSFTVKCSKGTYIRTLCHDIGQELGCGAHMTALQRQACGPFDLSASYTPEQLQKLADDHKPLPLVPAADALVDWVPLQLQHPAIKRLQDGVAPKIEEITSGEAVSGDKVKFLVDGELLALANCVPGRVGKTAGDFELLKVFPLEKEG